MDDSQNGLATLVDRAWSAGGGGPSTPVDWLTVHRFDRPTGLFSAVYRPCLCVVAQGAKESTIGDCRRRYEEGEYLLATVDAPAFSQIVAARPDRPYLALVVSIDPDLVADLMSGPNAPTLEPPPSPPLSTAPAPHALRDCLTRLLTLLEQPRDLPVLGPLILREIVWRTLDGPLGAALKQVGARDGASARIGRAAAAIRARFAERLSVPELAAEAHMSVPSFHRHFKAVTTMTPVQFQKQLRLQEARRRVFAGEAIAAAAFAVGYESASQFSREYSRAFGAPPGRDRTAARATSGRHAS